MTNDTTKRITLPGAIATARFAFRAALTQLIAGGTPMTHSAFIDGDRCTGRIMSELTPRMRYIIGEVLDMVDVDTLNDNLALDTAPDTSREELNAIQSVLS